MTTAISPILFKKHAVCERLSVSLRTLEGMVKTGEFPPPVRMGKYVYWTESAITTWLSRAFGTQEAWRPR